MEFIKNPIIGKSISQAAKLPIVPSSGYGDTPTDGIIRFNQATSRIEFYYGNAWRSVAQIGSVQLVVDTFTGDGTTTAFTMTQTETDPTAIIVTIGGVYQLPTTHYTVSGTTITFTSAPPAPGVNPNQIMVLHNINSTNAV